MNVRMSKERLAIETDRCIQTSSFLVAGEVSAFAEKCTDEQALKALDSDPLGVVTHYALTKLNEIITTLATGVSGVTVSSVFYVGKDGVLVAKIVKFFKYIQF